MTIKKAKIRIARRKGPFAPIEEAIEAVREGRMIIVVDDEDRENEGDLTIAAEKITPEAINFMARLGRGLICMPMTAERLDQARSDKWHTFWKNLKQGYAFFEQHRFPPDVRVTGKRYVFD